MISLLLGMIILNGNSCESQDSLFVLFWNLENFFDYKNDSLSVSDAEFSSRGEKKWTKKRFQTKCNAVSKAIMQIADTKGRFPDVIGFAEIENKWVLNRLLHDTLLDKLDYAVVHYDSPDVRGIDVALLYRKSVFNLIDSKPCHIPDGEGSFLRTRDMLVVTLERIGGERMEFIVAHHPSKYGGAASEPRRLMAMQRLRDISDSLSAYSSQIVAMGDFNDTPDAPAFALLDGSMVNASQTLFERGEGSIRFQGKWELIDLFFVSPCLSERVSAEVAYIPFLMTEDRPNGGLKPLRTYSGPRYIGGVSDHCPIILTIHFGSLRTLS